MLHDQLMIGLSILTVLSSVEGTVTLRNGFIDRIKDPTAAIRVQLWLTSLPQRQLNEWKIRAGCLHEALTDSNCKKYSNAT